MQWFFEQFGDDGSFGLYKVDSALNVRLAMGNVEGSPAGVAADGTVFNVSVDATSGLFV